MRFNFWERSIPSAQVVSRVKEAVFFFLYVCGSIGSSIRVTRRIPANHLSAFGRYGIRLAGNGHSDEESEQQDLCHTAAASDNVSKRPAGWTEGTKEGRKPTTLYLGWTTRNVYARNAHMCVCVPLPGVRCRRAEDAELRKGNVFTCNSISATDRIRSNAIGNTRASWYH